MYVEQHNPSFNMWASTPTSIKRRELRCHERFPKSTPITGHSTMDEQHRHPAFGLPTPPRTPPLPTSTVLDHTSYPHIFDLILYHAPPLALLALRAACHSLRSCADSLLAKHVVYTDCARTPDGAVRFPASDPRFAHTRTLDLFVAESSQATHAHSPCYGCEARCREDAFESLLRAAPLFRRLEVVRFRGDFELEWAEANALSQALRARWAVYLVDAAAGLPRRPIVLPRARMVLSIDLRQAFSLNLASLQCLKGEVYTCVKWPESPAAMEKRRREATYACFEDVCTAVGELIFAWRPPARYIFVGVESWDERWFLPSSRSQASDGQYYDLSPRPGGSRNVRSMVAKLSDAPRDRDYPERATAVVQKHVHFLSLDEFCALAGDDIAGLITSA